MQLSTRIAQAAYQLTYKSICITIFFTVLNIRIYGLLDFISFNDIQSLSAAAYFVCYVMLLMHNYVFQ